SFAARAVINMVMRYADCVKDRLPSERAHCGPRTLALPSACLPASQYRRIDQWTHHLMATNNTAYQKVSTSSSCRSHRQSSSAFFSFTKSIFHFLSKSTLLTMSALYCVTLLSKILCFEKSLRQRRH